MSKVVAGTAFVLLTGATVTGSVLLTRNSGENQDQADQCDHELPTDLDFAKLKEEGCVKSTFPEAKDLTEPGDGEIGESDLAADFFGSGESDTTTGCLVVNWDKETYSGNKWKGTVRFLWAVKGSNNKGLLAYLVGTPSNASSAQSIKWAGSAYTLAFEGNENAKKWNIKKKRGVPTSGGTTVEFKKDTSDNENKKFPGPGAVLNMGDNSDFWGFFENVDALTNICSTATSASECKSTEESTAKFMGYWDWTGKRGENESDTQKKLSAWTKDLSKCCQAIFGAQCKVKEAADKQIGTWTERFKEPKTSSQQ